MAFFNGKEIRDKILLDLKQKISNMSEKPTLAVICVGDNPVCSRYVGLKKKVADQIGVNFIDLGFGSSDSQEKVIKKIEELNNDDSVSGIMIQMPVPKSFDKFEIVQAVSPAKDVDGLRFCCNYKSNFKPPVVLSILKAIEISSVCHSGLDPESREDYIGSPGHGLRLPEDDKSVVDCLKDKKVVIVGRGFLVGWPLARCLEEAVPDLVVADSDTKNLSEITQTADIIISAVGKHEIITPNMVKDGVVLVDAGTTEVSGELRGDIDLACYEKASYYTPVPGGIGPVTIAMLMKNLVTSESASQHVSR